MRSADTEPALPVTRRPRGGPVKRVLRPPPLDGGGSRGPGCTGLGLTPQLCGPRTTPQPQNYTAGWSRLSGTYSMLPHVAVPEAKNVEGDSCWPEGHPRKFAAWPWGRAVLVWGLGPATPHTPASQPPPAPLGLLVLRDCAPCRPRRVLQGECPQGSPALWPSSPRGRDGPDPHGTLRALLQKETSTTVPQKVLCVLASPGCPLGGRPCLWE